MTMQRVFLALSRQLLHFPLEVNHHLENGTFLFDDSEPLLFFKMVFFSKNQHKNGKGGLPGFRS